MLTSHVCLIPQIYTSYTHCVGNFKRTTSKSLDPAEIPQMPQKMKVSPISYVLEYTHRDLREVVFIATVHVNHVRSNRFLLCCFYYYTCHMAGVMSRRTFGHFRYFASIERWLIRLCTAEYSNSGNEHHFKLK